MTFNDTIKNLETYEAGKPIELVVRDFGIKAEDVIKLASNENPYGTSPKVVKKISALANNMYLYPDDSMFELKENLAKKFEVKKNNIIIGSGSDQIIEFCIHAKSNKDSKILMAKTTFAMYEIYGKHVGAKIIKTKNEMHNLKEFLELYKLEKPNIIFLCIPNNPLGECLDTNEIYNFLDKINSDTMVVIDGAYQEFAAYKDKNKKITPSELIKKYPNCIYLGTFSKAYGLGGARVGYGIGSKEIIDALSKLRAPFNITTLSLAAATEALKDEEFIKNYLEKNLLEMKKYENFAKEKKLDFIDSYTNFITIKMGEKYNSKEISNKLLKEGIIIRDLTNYKQNAIRITIGTSEQNKKVLKILNKII